MPHTIEFTKMHGAGNDYVYVNALKYPLANPEELAVAWSNRHTGIGGDGLILICEGRDGADFSMRMFNNDGSEGKMCGNGTRCIAKYVYEYGLTTKTEVSLWTLSGIKILKLHLDDNNKVASVTVDMGTPTLADTAQCATADGSLTEAAATSTDGKTYTGTFVSMGNPHFVVFVDDADTFDVAGVGPTLEWSPLFPERCNIEFATVRPDGSIRMRVWERGTGITMACGTGACATLVAAALTKRTGSSADLVLDGGTLHIELSTTDGHVMMTGPATTVFDGTIEVTD